jgi:hypothetical protein
MASIAMSRGTVGEREALVAREAVAEPIQAGHEIGLGVPGRDGRDDVAREKLECVHILFYVGVWI